MKQNDKARKIMIITISTIKGNTHKNTEKLYLSN